MKDAVGNELHVGDLVMVQIATPIVFGRIVELNEGGIVTGINHKGGSEVRPARLLIAATHTVDADPRAPVRAVVALRDDSKPQDSAGDDKPSGEYLESLN